MYIKNGKKVFEFNINGYEEGEDIRYEFSSMDELLKNAKIEGKRFNSPKKVLKHNIIVRRAHFMFQASSLRFLFC